MIIKVIFRMQSINAPELCYTCLNKQARQNEKYAVFTMLSMDSRPSSLGDMSFHKRQRKYLFQFLSEKSAPVKIGI